MMNASHAPSFVSVFERTFDVVVCGAGLIGYAAARRLAEDGSEVLLVEPSGDLLWEASRALENAAEASPGTDPAWAQWLGALEVNQGVGCGWFDPAVAEITAAHELAEPNPRLSTLLYSVPLAMGCTEGRADALTLATKSGPRTVRARHWVDATENGMLARLGSPGQLAPIRAPKAVYRSLVLQSLQPELLDSAAIPFLRDHPEVEWLGSLRASERRMRWATGGSWHRETIALVRSLRAAVEGTGATFAVSHIALRDYPVYSAMEGSGARGAWPVNLTVLSPALRCEELLSPADRFALGRRVLEEICDGVADGAQNVVSQPLVPMPIECAGFDVVVAGAGTSGALAAIAAGRSGVHTVVFDATTYPGGVGTGGAITSYYYGSSDGMQKEVDRRSQEMGAILSGIPQTSANHWHHDAKMLVLMEMFDEAGVVFLENALLWNVEKTGSRVDAVQVVADGRLERLPAKAFIDGTGDGDLCALAGAESIGGRPGDGGSLAYTQSDFFLNEGLKVQSSNFDAGWVDPTDPEDLSRARLEGIAQYLRPLQTGVHRSLAMAPLIGIRQSRQIRTDAEITFADMVLHARFDDAIGRTNTVADTHSVDFEFESDEMAFYYWTCRSRSFRQYCQLPYGMLLPRGLSNVWVPCRAAGMTASASYGLRMQRDLQRLGEAAGRAAALAVKAGTDARGIDLPTLQTALGQAELSEDEAGKSPLLEPLAQLDQGIPGVHLWHLFQDPARYRQALLDRISVSTAARPSFYAAAVLSMWGDDRAEERLLRALDEREIGPTPEEYLVPGSHGQCTDLPFWMQAVVLLRVNGTERCLPSLRRLAGQPGLPLNVRTTLALTLERLATRLVNAPLLAEILGLLTADEIPDPRLKPSRSLWRKLQQEPQKKLGNDRGADTAQDQTWQLHLVVARARQVLGLPLQNGFEFFCHDPRAFVRVPFKRLLAAARPCGK